MLYQSPSHSYSSFSQGPLVTSANLYCTSGCWNWEEKWQINPNLPIMHGPLPTTPVGQVRPPPLAVTFSGHWWDKHTPAATCICTAFLVFNSPQLTVSIVTGWEELKTENDIQDISCLSLHLSQASSMRTAMSGLKTPWKGQLVVLAVGCEWEGSVRSKLTG